MPRSNERRPDTLRVEELVYVELRSPNGEAQRVYDCEGVEMVGNPIVDNRHRVAGMFKKSDIRRLEWFLAMSPVERVGV